MEQHATVFSLPLNLYATGAPVVIAEGRLLKDRQTGKLSAYLKFCNIQRKPVTAVRVRISLLDAFTHPLAQPVEQEYLNLRAERDSVFGEDVEISVEAEKARSFTVSVEEVAFGDQTLWQSAGEIWEPLKAPVLLVQALNNWQRSRAYAEQVGGNCPYWPEEEKDLWRCGCGALNREGEDCHICGRSYFTFWMVDMAALATEQKPQTASEEEAPPAQTPAVPEPKPKKKAARPKRRWMVLLLAIILLLCGLMVALLRYNPGPRRAGSAQPAPTVEAPPAEPTPAETAPLTEEEQRYQQAQTLEEDGRYAEAAIAFGKLSGYKDARERSFALWNGIAPRETLVTDNWRTVGVKNDGTVLAVGNNEYGQNAVSGWRDIISVCAAGTYTVGLKADGTVVAVGENTYGQCNVSGWTDIVAISASGRHTVGLKADGTVVATGDNGFGQCNVSGWTDVVQLATFAVKTQGEIFCYTAALRSDGTVVSAGENRDGWRDPVSGWTDIVAISAGGQHIVGIKADGTVVAVGSDRQLWALLPSRLEVSGWRDVVTVQATFMHTFALKSDGTVVAVGNQNIYHSLGVDDWRDIVQISVKDDQTVGLKSDGTVVAIGWNRYGGCDVSDWTGIIRVHAGGWHAVGLKSDGTVVAAGWNDFGQCDVSGWRDIRLPG